MAAAWFQFRIALRTRWRAWTATAVLAGFAAGVVMVAVAGARRTNSSLHRVVVDGRVADVFVGPNNGLLTAEQQDRYTHLPQVAGYAYLLGVPMVDLDSGEPEFLENTIVLANPDGHEFHDIDRPGVVAGRIPDADEEDALVINEAAVRMHHWQVGTKLQVGFPLVQDLDSPQTAMAHALRRTLTVAGIVRPLDDATRAADDPRLQATLVFTRSLSRILADRGGFYDGLQIRLHDTSQLRAYEATVRREAGANVLSLRELSGTLERARRSVRPYVFALWLFAGLALLAGAAVIAQILARQRRIELADRPVLRALGATRPDLVRRALVRGVFLGGVAAVTATAVAVATSPVMPIGPLRTLEPNRGVDADFAVLGLGLFLLVVGLVGYVVIGAARRPAPARNRRHRLLDAVGASGAPVPVTTGVRLALDPGRGERAVPVVSTMLGVGLAITALVATLVYAANLTHFTSTPRLYGWVWSYQVEPVDTAGEQVYLALASRLARDPHVEAAAVGAYAQVAMQGKTVGAIAVQSGRSVPVAEVVSGREPRRADEIVLGATTMRNLDRGIGDDVDATIGDVTRRFTIVGRAVFPRFAPYSASEPTGLGIGAAMTLEGLARFGSLDGTSAESPIAASAFVLVDARPGTRAADVERVAKQGIGDLVVLGPQRPNDVTSYEHVERTPLALAGLLVLLATAAMIHLLVTAVRRRRRELGLLRALGLTAGQLRRAVLVQAATLILICLVVAVPLGVIGGRVLWTLTARGLGIPVVHQVPGGPIALVIGGAFVVGVVAALVPAIRAGRVQPAEILRSE